jgi:hypothetical protein
LTSPALNRWLLAAPATSAYGVANLPPAGAAALMVSGFNFGSGLTPSLSIASSLCTTSSWSSATSLMCQSPAGFGAVVHIAVQVASTAGTGSAGYLLYDMTSAPSFVPTTAPSSVPTAPPSVAPSEPTLRIDCSVADWASWGPCSVTCAGGTASKSRSVTTPPSGAGSVCPATQNDRTCNTHVCPVDCSVRECSKLRF